MGPPRALGSAPHPKAPHWRLMRMATFYDFIFWIASVRAGRSILHCSPLLHHLDLLGICRVQIFMLDQNMTNRFHLSLMRVCAASPTQGSAGRGPTASKKPFYLGRNYFEEQRARRPSVSLNHESWLEKIPGVPLGWQEQPGARR